MVGLFNQRRQSERWRIGWHFSRADASDVTQELWDSNQNQTRDYAGSWAKWCPPTIANGKVYLATFDNVLNVYGLLTPASGGALLGSGTSSAAAVNLTTEGSTDWEHWGDGHLNRKAGVSSQLSAYTALGTGTVFTYGNDPRPMSWTDGTPTASSTDNTNGLSIQGVGQGFSFQAPADTTTRTLIVHVGGWNSGGELTAHLTDGSAADFTDATALASAQYDRNYTLTYHAASAGQTLTVTWAMTAGSGNVTLCAAALDGATVVASGGTPQSATLGSVFATALQTTVTDGGGNPISGATVLFLAPVGGASGTFAGGSTSANVITGTNGIAVAPAFTANGVAGAYTVTASGSGIAQVATFSLTNTSLLSGTLSGSGTSSAALVNLTLEGALDWEHWGDTSLNRKAGVSAQLTTYMVLGGGDVLPYGNDPRPVSWTDGTPTASSSNNTNGAFVAGIGQGFSFTAPADTTTRTLTVHAGGWESGGTLTAHLSDGSAMSYTDVTAAVSGQYDRNYTLTYAAASAGQTLTVSWVMSSGSGNVTFNAAALNAPATNVAASGGTPQSATVNAAFVTALQAIVTSGGTPMSGVTVTFTAAASGPSGTFAGGLTTASVTTGANGIAVAPEFTANGQTGSYSVTASVVGVTAPAIFSLTNNSSIASWYNTSWNWRKPLTIHHTQVSGGSSLANFPVLFSVTDPNLSTVANGGGTGKADGSDILFTTSDGITKLNHELEYYNPTTGQVIAWVQVPAISPTADILLYLYYGNPAAPNEQNSAGVWDANYLAVYHMADDAGSTLITDSTGVNAGAATAETNAKTIQGEISGALLFNGSTDYITVAQNGRFNLDAHPFTLESWVRDDSTPSNLVIFHRIISWYDGTRNIQLGLGQDSTATERVFYLMNAPTGAPAQVVSSGDAPAGFNHVVVTFDGAGTYHIYLNGAVADGGSLKAGNITAFTSSAANLYLGQRGDDSLAAYLDGTLDETRVSNVARSPGWIATEYNNQTSPNSFVSSGGAQHESTDSLEASGGTPQSATVNTAFAAPLQVTLTSGGNPVSGVTVTFAAPTSGASGTFAGGSTTASVATGGNGIAVSPTFTADSQTGSYSVTASVSGVTSSATLSLTNTATVTNGSLSGSGTSSAALVNLTSEGTLDWEHWGDGSLNRKVGVTAQLGAYTVMGSGNVLPYGNDPRPLSWTDGAPTAGSSSNTNGVFISGVGQGFSFTAPADTTKRTLLVHGGGWDSGGTLTAHLSDGSAVNYVDVTANVSGQYDRNYTLTYAAASAGQTLTVSWVMNSGDGNVTFNAAALQ